MLLAFCVFIDVAFMIYCLLFVYSGRVLLGLAIVVLFGFLGF